MSKLPKLRDQHFFFHMRQASWCHRVHSTQRWSVTNIALQGEEITRALDEMYHAHLLRKQTMRLRKEQHLDSAMLEACHSLGKMCVKWLESKKSL